SWSALFADFDLDGQKDIFIANGILRRSNDLDYVNYVSVDSIQMSLTYDLNEKHLKLIERMPKIKLQNFLYANNGDSTFTDKATEWGLNKASYSHGAAYGDLDNDGDVDLVVNNVEDEAFLIENLFVDENQKNGRRFLRIRLKGNSGNQFGIGAKVFMYSDNGLQMQECQPVRGYQSSVDPRLIFGLGQADMVDSLWVIWPDDSYQSLYNVKTNQEVQLSQSDATKKFDYNIFHNNEAMLQETTASLAIDFKHKENKFVEFTREALLPHMLSAEGPAAAVGDVNGDGREDVFIGGAKWQISGLYLQMAEGNFKKSFQQVFRTDSTQENVDAVFFDADGDSDNDLLVVTGGNEFTGTSPHLKPKLYLNDGKGNFTASRGLPDLYITGSSVSIADYDGDHDIDIFLGVRTVPFKYGIEPDNFLLRNDGKGNFADVTDDVAPSLRKFGFVKDAVWADIDMDDDPDLVIAAEWKPVTILINNKGNFSPLKDSGLELSNGWWNHLNVGDFDVDGDLDIIAGNLGLNASLKTSAENPVKMYVSDFDNNGTTEQLLTHFMKGKEYPYYTRDEMVKQMPGLKKKFLSFTKYAEATADEIFDPGVLGKAAHFEAYTFESVFIENKGGGKFTIKSLPSAAQFSSVHSSVVDDFNQDGKLDILLAGNFYPLNIQMGRLDASYGCLLLGDGKGNFVVLPNKDSGVRLEGETRRLKKINVGGRAHYLAFRNNNTVVSFSKK
ncbi:MAG TPA: VCBS repeat-containing protein, partial [Chryseolinea sp.]